MLKEEEDLKEFLHNISPNATWNVRVWNMIDAYLRSSLSAMTREKEEAEGENRRLREAVRDLNALIISAQETMTAYIVPDGIEADDAIERVIELLDGPRQREVQKAAFAALSGKVTCEQPLKDAARYYMEQVRPAYRTEEQRTAEINLLAALSSSAPCSHEAEAAKYKEAFETMQILKEGVSAANRELGKEGRQLRETVGFLSRNSVEIVPHKDGSVELYVDRLTSSDEESNHVVAPTLIDAVELRRRACGEGGKG